MFKSKRYFEVVSLHHNKQWNEHKTGYLYNYISVGTFLTMLRECVMEYNSNFSKKALDLIVLASLDEQHAQFALVGKTKHIQKFMTDLLTTEGVCQTWSISEVSKYSVVH